MLLISTLLLVTAAEVVRLPATAQRSLFDAKNPPAQIPKIDKRESALTESRFGCRVQFAHEVVSESARDDGVEVSLKLTDARIELSLDTLIHVPDNVRATLRAHEEAHRVINERIYERESETIVRRLSDRAIARTWTAVGSVREIAARNALQQASGELRASYRKEIAQRVAQVNERFDELTAHGAREDMNIIDAIEQSLSAIPTTQVTERTPPPAPRGERSP